jgi:hypothetical protein
VAELDGDITANSATMTDLVCQSRAAVLLEKTGIGPVTAAIALTAWSHLDESAPKPRSPASLVQAPYWLPLITTSAIDSTETAIGP